MYSERRTQVPIFQEGVPRIWGSGGEATVSARCAKALIGAVPRRRFAYFAAACKVGRPAGRNPSIKLRKNYNSSSTQKVTAIATTPKLATASQ